MHSFRTFFEVDVPGFKSHLNTLKKFQNDVQKDPSKYSRPALQAMMDWFIQIGQPAFTTMMGQYVLSMGTNYWTFMDRYLVGARDRFAWLWRQYMIRAFSTAIDSIEQTLRKPTIYHRIQTQAAITNMPLKTAGTHAAQVAGLVRTSRSPDGFYRYFSIGIASYVKMVARTLPMAFQRHMDTLVVKATYDEKRIPNFARLVRVTPGVVQESAETCIQCQGRVMTIPAYEYVQRWLQPSLHHPNCRHGIDRSFLENITDYDGRFGPVIHLEDVEKWPARFRKIKVRTRPNPFVNVVA